MALSHALLVTLLDKPQTGYELGKRFDRTVGFFWRARHQQIYAELHRMADKGWVVSETISQQERPNRIVYSVTAAGREALQGWAGTYVSPPSVKEELVVKLFALGEIPAATLVEQVQQRLADHRQNLAIYQQVLVDHYPEPDRLKPRARGRYLGLRSGILNEETGIRWCEEALRTLQLPYPEQSAD